ncbi:MAG: hypothetical protein ACUVWJ_01625 [Spirochaetota bacterium]
MSNKKSIAKENTNILKSIIRHITEVKLSARTLDEIALNAIRTKPVIDILSEIRFTHYLPECSRDDMLLTHFIEMLAIIHSIIDSQLIKLKLLNPSD